VENVAEREAAMHGMGKSKSKAKMKKLHTHKLEIERADGGGHILRHHMKDEDGNDGPMHTSVATDNEDMQQQAGDAMADQPAAGAAAPPEAQPDPTQGQGDPSMTGQ
jgi:hypothetical protein